jgi:hypothetical protein
MIEEGIAQDINPEDDPPTPLTVKKKENVLQGCA